MIQSQPGRPPNVAVIVVLGFIAGFGAEFVIDLVLDFVVRPHSQTESDVLSVVIALLTGAVVGGAMFLGRPRHYGLTAVVGASVVVSGIIADELATPVYFAVHHLPISADLFTGYFTHARPMFFIANLISVAVAAGLTALRVARVRAAGGTSPGAGAPPGSWGPPQAPGEPRGPWSPPPQAPYGSPPYGPPSPPSYDPPPNAPYGPPGR